MADELVGKEILAGLLIHVESEDASLDVEIPKHKVEKGIDIADHVEREPVIVKLSGLLVRPTADRVESLVTKLYDAEKTGRLVTYEGRRIYKNMLLSGLSIQATGSVSNGYRFSCTLTEVEIAQPSYVAPTLQPQVKPETSSGRKQTENQKQSPIYHTVKKGDSYWALAKSYGASVKELQSWNTYSAEKIPIGAKLRVG